MVMVSVTGCVSGLFGCCVGLVLRGWVGWVLVVCC